MEDLQREDLPSLSGSSAQAPAGSNSEGTQHAMPTSGLSEAARSTHKVSLQRYRKVSRQIFAIFTELLGEHCVEKASVDEAFFDVTSIVESLLDAPGAELQAILSHAVETIRVQGQAAPHGLGPGWDPPAGLRPWGHAPSRGLAHWIPHALFKSAGSTASESSSLTLPDWNITWPKVEGGNPPEAATVLPVSDQDSLRLVLGAHIAAHVRREVWLRMGFTCSAGISHNKLLAKLASATAKPNQQTLVPVACVLPMLSGTPLSKIRSLGGKVGTEACSHWGVETAGEALRIPLVALTQRLGEKTGQWVFRAVRGQCEEEVRGGQTTVKSMLAAKSFAPKQGSTRPAVRQWLGMLVADLASRMVPDAALNQRSPKTLTVYWRHISTKSRYSLGRSKSCPMPPQGKVGATEMQAWRAEEQGTATPQQRAAGAEALAHRKAVLLEKCVDMLHTVSDAELMPCTRLAMAAAGFTSTAVLPGQARLAKFLASSTAPHHSSRASTAAVDEPSGAPTSRTEACTPFWACAVCTMHNPPDTRVCGACGAWKPASSAPSANSRSTRIQQGRMAAWLQGSNGSRPSKRRSSKSGRTPASAPASKFFRRH